MVVTRSQVEKRMLRKQEKSQGPRGSEATTTTKCNKIKEMKKKLSREIDKCKKFIATNLRFLEVLDSEIRQLCMLRVTMPSRFKKWRIPNTSERLAGLVENVMNLYDENEDESENESDDEDAPDEELNEDFALEAEDILRWWLGLNIEAMREEKFEMERRIRPITRTILQLELYLMNRKMEHEDLHVKLCQKLMSMEHSRQKITTKL